MLPTSMSAASGLIIRTGVVKTYSLGFSTTHTQIFIYISTHANVLSNNHRLALILIPWIIFNVYAFGI